MEKKMYHKIYQDQRKNAVHIYFIRYLETFSKLKKNDIKQ